MELVHRNFAIELILLLRDTYKIQSFVETGTFEGETAVWASLRFKKVITIENSMEIYEKTLAKCAEKKNITFILGDSRSVLRSVVPTLDSPSIFWLDAHWSGGTTYGENDECPLIQEIQAIKGSDRDHFVFIDDARLFLLPPPRPHKIEQWPSIDAIIEALNSGRQRCYMVICEDVIVAVPWYAKQLVASYCQKLSTRNWEEYLRHQNECALTPTQIITQRLSLVKQGFVSILRRLKSSSASSKLC